MIAFISLFGGFACRAGDGSHAAMPSAKVRALFAYLAVTPGRRHDREALAALFWADSRADRARANLRKTLSRLRQTLPAALRPCLLADAEHVAVAAELIDTDLGQFERGVDAATPDSLEQAVELYRGELLAGLSGCGPVFDDWLDGERRRLAERLQQALQLLLDHYLSSGAIDSAIQTALRLLELDPLRESVHCQLMRLYLQQDRVGSALAQYRRCREQLAAELGIEPGAAVEQVYAELQRRNATSAPHAPPPPETDDLPERPAITRTAAADRARRRAELSERPSIAVLRFQSAAAALGVGLAEDLATALGRFRELDVIAPGAALAYRGATATPTQVGVELGVAYICEGTIKTAAERPSVTVRLVEVATDRQLWAEQFSTDDAPQTLLDSVVRHVGGVLIGHIEHARLSSARRRPAGDWQAYDFWLRGKAALRQTDSAALREARHCFQQALARDPYFSRAYVGLATAQLNEWACVSWNHWVFPGAQTLDLARKAVALDEHDHQAQCILGMTQLYQRDYAGAHQRLTRALQLNPNDADVLAHAAAGLALVGEHHAAVEAGRRALRLAPHRPEWYAAFAGIALFAARRYREAIATMACAPEALCNTPAFIAAAYAYLGETERCSDYRATVLRHYQRQVGRGLFPADTRCVDWLLALDPFQQPDDLAHYADGLRRAGF